MPGVHFENPILLYSFHCQIPLTSCQHNDSTTWMTRAHYPHLLVDTGNYSGTKINVTQTGTHHHHHHRYHHHHHHQASSNNEFNHCCYDIWTSNRGLKGYSTPSLMKQSPFECLPLFPLPLTCTANVSSTSAHEGGWSKPSHHTGTRVNGCTERTILLVSLPVCFKHTHLPL